eukprot:GILI01026986.1.p1 GENE.GILI01026986.1~~GILI01026986.1.p1  ORF type:complete len:120 (-),score=18.77 GILI01026986.1:69-392(-)
MASVGADVQSTNNELVQLIEEMRERRSDVDKNIRREEEERNKIVAEMKTLAERLRLLDDSIARKQTARNEFDRTIHETSNQFTKILESSRLLLSSVKQDSMSLAQRM